MADTVQTTAASPALFTNVSAEAITHDHQAYSILHWGYTALPAIAGIDKFTHALCDWTMYLAPQFGQILGPGNTMRAVGVIEIIAGLGVALKPRLFAPVVACWLWGIIINLLLLGSYYDVALRDFGLSLGALGLFRLSQHFDLPGRKVSDHSVGK
jgi:hypothetical protein